MKTDMKFFNPAGLRKIAILVGLVFFCLLPFSGALEIHHVFAEVDHDGHEHSDFDLCQWVQQHANGIFTFEKPLTEVLPLVVFQEKFSRNPLFVSLLGLLFQLPRPPPFS